MTDFEWKPRKRELHIPFNSGGSVCGDTFVFKFDYDSHNRLWKVSIPTFSRFREIILTKAEGEKIQFMLNKMNGAIRWYQQHLRYCERYQDTLYYFDYDSATWKPRNIFYREKKMIDYSDSYYDEVYREYQDGTVSHHPFGVTNSIHYKGNIWADLRDL